MREPGSDGNLNVMFFKKFQIICVITLLTKDEEGLNFLPVHLYFYLSRTGGGGVKS